VSKTVALTFVDDGRLQTGCTISREALFCMLFTLRSLRAQLQVYQLNN
jgi:hypothetical protein